jgi:hypothetical protein
VETKATFTACQKAHPQTAPRGTRASTGSGPEVSKPRRQHGGHQEAEACRQESGAKKTSLQEDGAQENRSQENCAVPRETPVKKKAAALRSPRGGLTAAGRRAFARKEGAHLKPGVKKPVREMTVEDMRRKGSWAVRFYGRSGQLPPLVDAHKKPTRFALTAAAWGEPVPRTVAAARRIAAKGGRLLERAKRVRAKRR